MSASGSKSVTKVMRFLKEHLREFPEEAAAIMISVQAGEFAVKKPSGEEDTLPEYKKVIKLSEELKVSMLQQWMPKLTDAIIARVKREAKASQGDDVQIISKMWLLMTLESADAPLATRSRAVLKELYENKRRLYPIAPTVTFDAKFSIDWDTCGVYLLDGSTTKKDGDQSAYTAVIHRYTKAKLPRTIIAIVGDCKVIDNYDQRAASITNNSGDFKKCIWELMPQDALAKYEMKAVLKQDAAKDNKVQAAAQALIAKQGEAKGAATSSGAQAATPITKPKRGLKRNLSEMSVPEELASKQAK